MTGVRVTKKLSKAIAIIAAVYNVIVIIIVNIAVVIIINVLVAVSLLR